MDFALTILGVSGAVPAQGRFPTAQVLQVQNHCFLIDCGEGTQMRMSQFDIPRNKIAQIFISHLHGDHIFGLPGLLFSYALNNRDKPIDLFSPIGLKEMILAQLNPGTQLPFRVRFHVFDCEESRVIFENNELTVSTVPLDHRIPTCGFLFREKPFQKNIDPEKIARYNLSIPQIKSAKEGHDIPLGERLVPNRELTLPAYRPRSFAYISDTAYREDIVPIVKDVDLLYHETTFCEDAAENAVSTMHSTAKQAAKIAKMANAGTLVTGHYSSRYKELDCFEEEAKAVFPNTELGLEGKVYRVERKRIDD